MSKVVVASVGIMTSSVQVASGTAKLALDIKGNNTLSDKLPSSYFETIGMSLDIIIDDKQHTVQGSLKLVEGIILWEPKKIPKNAPEWLRTGISASNIFTPETYKYFEGILKNNDKSKKEK